jgi:CNT family concentrative nucleoside transporter
VKLSRTEFTAYLQMGAPGGAEGLSDRTRIMMTYALCGFANFVTVGTTALGLTVLAPERRQEILDLVWKSLVAGFLANVMSGTIVGLLPLSVIAK